MLLIIAHGGGHSPAGRLVGMRVENFALFFGPPIWKKQVGETEYSIRTIPAGGYVKITGMNPSEQLSDEARTRSYYAQPVWKRIVVISAGAAGENPLRLPPLRPSSRGIRGHTGDTVRGNA